MGKIDNEIVKFIAEVELDPQTSAEYKKGLQEAENHNAALRKSISETIQKMDELKAAGKENSAEFQRHKASLEADTKALKESTKQAEKYSSALGIQAMNYSQLQKHAKQVRAAMNSVHKEANPELWEKYNKELIATQKRMNELKGGADKTKGVLGGMFKKIIPTFDVVQLGLKAVNGLVKLGKKIWNDAKEETQKWGDAIQVEMAAVNAVWSHFIRNLSAGRGEITLSYQEVAKLAREAAKLKDEIFELTNSYKIMEAEATPRMQELEAIFRDTSKPIEERKAALKEMKELELSLAQDRLLIAQQEEEAAYKNFRAQTAMDRESAESFIKNYLEAKKSGLVEETEAYEQMVHRLQYLDDIVASGAFFSKKTYQGIYDEQEQLRQKIADTSEEVKTFYRELSQYNLGNDAATSAYANAVAGRLSAQAAADPSAMEAKYVRLNGQLNGSGRGGGSSRQSRKDREYQQRIAAAEEAYKQEQLALKNALLKQEITESEYRAKTLTAEMAMYNNKIAIAQQYGKDTLTFENALADKRLEIQRRFQASLDKTEAEFQRMLEQDDREMEEMMDAFLEEINASIEAELEDMPDPIRRLSELAEKAMHDEMKSRAGKLAVVRQEQETELAALEEMHEMMLLTEEEYQARRKDLAKETARQIAEINLETWTNSFEIAGQYLSQMQELVTTLQDAELESLEAQKQKELTIAGDNADERQRIEEDYEAKKLETEKKYADANMAINIAMTIANGAVAAMKAFADLGPIAGAVMAGLLAATTIAQVAVIIAQRNAIKNASTSSSATSAAASDVVGFSDGGYTGDGGRLDPAGVVHRGEYVVAAPELRDPYVARQVASIERLRRARVGGRSRLPGFADGGYTDQGTGAALQSPEVERKLDAITEVLLDIYDNPIPAYMLSSQYEAEMLRQERHKKFSSLRRKKK